MTQFENIHVSVSKAPIPQKHRTSHDVRDGEGGKERARKKIWQVHKAVCFNCGHVAASATTVWPNLTFHLLCLFLLHLFWVLFFYIQAILSSIKWKQWRYKKQYWQYNDDVWDSIRNWSKKEKSMLDSWFSIGGK